MNGENPGKLSGDDDTKVIGPTLASDPTRPWNRPASGSCQRPETGGVTCVILHYGVDALSTSVETEAGPFLAGSLVSDAHSSRAILPWLIDTFRSGENEVVPDM